MSCQDSECTLDYCRCQDMTYSESARGVLITRERVEQELAAHGVTSDDEIAECLAECQQFEYTANGPRRFYDAGDVLDWLGY